MFYYTEKAHNSMAVNQKASSSKVSIYLSSIVLYCIVVVVSTRNCCCFSLINHNSFPFQHTQTPFHYHTFRYCIVLSYQHYKYRQMDQMSGWYSYLWVLTTNSSFLWSQTMRFFIILSLLKIHVLNRYIFTVFLAPWWLYKYNIIRE